MSNANAVSLNKFYTNIAAVNICYKAINFVFVVKKQNMKNLFLPLFDFNNGAFIMIGIFSLVIFGLVGAVMFLMNTDKKKKNDQ